MYLLEMLTADGCDIEDLGALDPNVSVDYPDVARQVADKLLADPEARGILICGTGAGVAIAANRFRHIRASRCDRPGQAADDRFHDDINVLALAADDCDPEMAFATAQSFLGAPFDAAERRIRRIKAIS